MSATTPFAILTICTGNICRSPAMELLLTHELAGVARHREQRFVVSSAGTHALTGWSVNPSMGRLLESHGIEVNDFRARQAEREMLTNADLILTATRNHREWVVTHAPSAIRRTFTLTEFADAHYRTAHFRSEETGHPPETPRPTPIQLVEWTAAHRPPPEIASRSKTNGRGYVEGDILDPYRLGDAAFEATFTQIASATALVSAALGATTS